MQASKEWRERERGGDSICVCVCVCVWEGHIFCQLSSSEKH